MEETFIHPTTEPPKIHGKKYLWALSHDIERVCTHGMEFDDLTILPVNVSASITYEYCRVAPNKWALKSGNYMLFDRGNPILANDLILMAAVRPDVAIVNQSTKPIIRDGMVIMEPKTFYTCSN